MMKRVIPVFIALATLSGVAAWSAGETGTGAKGMFYKQMDRPDVQMNNGVQYWIELKRGGQVTQVSNKFAFKSGDQIKFHIRPNTDCFAYVVLKEGSGGEQSVLFPHPQHPDNNRFKAGKDHIVPDDSFLTFDGNPGTEKLILLFSRNELNANRYLRDSNNEHVIIASSQTGSKDLVPGSVVVAFNEQIVDVPPEPKKPDTAVAKSNNSIALPNKVEDSITTVVHKDPTAVLALDISLTHQP